MYVWVVLTLAFGLPSGSVIDTCCMSCLALCARSYTHGERTEVRCSILILQQPLLVGVPLAVATDHGCLGFAWLAVARQTRI
jgi:hypothetical protein